MTEKSTIKRNDVSATLNRLEQQLVLGDERIRSGELCPKCKSALIDYDGLLNLMCPFCDLVELGCFT